MINELEHHGIKGQKWGERNYQNKDGTLTPAGKKRYAIGTIHSRTKNEVGQYYSPRKQQRMATQATKILKKSAKRNDVMAETMSKSAERLNKKGKVEKAAERMKMAQQFAKNSETIRRQMRDIAYGTLVAGRDFVVNTEASTNILGDMIGLVNMRVTKTVDFA